MINKIENNIIEILPDLISQTKSGDIKWKFMKGAPCLTSSFNHQNFMICKSENDEGVQVISLNFVDKNDRLVGVFQKWTETESEFKNLFELYSIAEKSKVLLTC